MFGLVDSPIAVEEAGPAHLARILIEDRVISQSGMEIPMQIVKSLAGKGMAGVQDHISLWVQRIGIDQRHGIAGRRERPPTELDFIRRPSQRQPGQNPANPRIGGGIAEQDQIIIAQVGRQHVARRLDPNVSPEIPREIRLKLLQNGIRAPGGADTHKRLLKGVVDWPLQAGPFPEAGRLPYPPGSVRPLEHRSGQVLSIEVECPRPIQF